MQSNQELSMSMFATKEDYETACAELNTFPEKIISDIKADPSLILQLNEGDQVSVDSVVLDVMCMPVTQQIYQVVVLKSTVSDMKMMMMNSKVSTKTTSSTCAKSKKYGGKHSMEKPAGTEKK